jgi:hypothetical protein
VSGCGVNVDVPDCGMILTNGFGLSQINVKIFILSFSNFTPKSVDIFVFQVAHGSLFYIYIFVSLSLMREFLDILF